MIPLALAALLIFFLFNSRRKQKARAEEIKSGLVPGATVMTTFGVFGTVLSIDEENNQVTLESGPGTVLRVHRQAIGQISNPEATGAAAGGAVADAPEAADDAESTDTPAITDAELDAMNERKRAEKTNGDTDLPADDVVDSDSELKSDATQVDADETDSVIDDATGSKNADDAVDGAGETDADAFGTDSSDPENPKKN
ncbi:preprotein translocase subunit YajC [Brevibacterium aurantiacum]|uniref:Preprotein translocase subunit YajC n=1 Tax=Brevibacterium aurantiacum TaxID=273384 RepID=A0A2A3ZVP0_BREAU|nr:preprotein translocase subunit YajC [Brevibacterium aurantiacum]AZT93731.1 preprotein translocase subunit YajC [Brevibacterium aurantiacum]PCC55517.1 preprotein translocase subunit YajC [Brevibacterium aurantiacum]